MSDNNNITLEERFEHIEEIIHEMENGEVSLDKSFDLYKNGLEEIKQFVINESIPFFERTE